MKKYQNGEKIIQYLYKILPFRIWFLWESLAIKNNNSTMLSL